MLPLWPAQRPDGPAGEARGAPSILPAAINASVNRGGRAGDVPFTSSSRRSVQSARRLPLFFALFWAWLI
jgi:hypothetical protein